MRTAMQMALKMVAKSIEMGGERKKRHKELILGISQDTAAHVPRENNLPVMGFVLAIILDRLTQTFIEGGGWLPTYNAFDLADIRIEIARFLSFAFWREGRE